MGMSHKALVLETKAHSPTLRADPPDVVVICQASPHITNNDEIPHGRPPESAQEQNLGFKPGGNPCTGDETSPAQAELVGSEQYLGAKPGGNACTRDVILSVQIQISAGKQNLGVKPGRSACSGEEELVLVSTLSGVKHLGGYMSWPHPIIVKHAAINDAAVFDQ